MRTRKNQGDSLTLCKLRFVSLFVLLVFAVLGCGAINPGPWKPPEFPPKNQKYYLLKDVFLTPGSAAYAKDSFDHAMNENVNLVFIPKNEKNDYSAESRWYDPNDQEYRTIRTHYDVKSEGKEDFERKKGGTPRTHSMPTKELVNHKAGMWKVALYLDNDLARELNFSVR